MNEQRAEIVFVDVDDTLVRSAGSKRIPITTVAHRVAALKEAGATLYCWSAGGADYAREVARELGLEHCFVAFLPKPTIMLDDQAPAEWRLCRHVHPFNVDSIEAEAEAEDGRIVQITPDELRAASAAKAPPIK